MLCAGFMFAKPDMSILLRPFLLEITVNRKGGIEILHAGRKERVKVFLSHVTVDAPAKADILNMKHHNGYCRVAKKTHLSLFAPHNQVTNFIDSSNIHTG